MKHQSIRVCNNKEQCKCSLLQISDFPVITFYRFLWLIHNDPLNSGLLPKKAGLQEFLTIFDGIA